MALFRRLSLARIHYACVSYKLVWGILWRRALLNDAILLFARVSCMILAENFHMTISPLGDYLIT